LRTKGGEVIFKPSICLEFLAITIRKTYIYCPADIRDVAVIGMITGGPRSIGSLSPTCQTTSYTMPELYLKAMKGRDAEPAHQSGCRVDLSKPGSGRLLDIIVELGRFDNRPGFKDSLQGILTRDGRIAFDPEPEIRMDNLKEKGFVINIKAWCEKDAYWEVLTDLLKALKMFFFKNGVPYKSVKSASTT